MDAALDPLADGCWLTALERSIASESRPYFIYQSLDSPRPRFNLNEVSLCMSFPLLL